MRFHEKLLLNSDQNFVVHCDGLLLSCRAMAVGLHPANYASRSQFEWHPIKCEKTLLLKPTLLVGIIHQSLNQKKPSRNFD